VRGFQTTCLVLATLALTTQGVRHLYVKYFARTPSVLDRFEKQEIKREIAEAATLDELVTRYEPARKRSDELDAERDREAEKLAEDKRNDYRNEFNRSHADEYSKAYSLRSAITDWEAKAKQVQELQMFWGAGAILFALGGLLYFKFPWVGMSLVVPGVAEMIWWTSPNFTFAGTTPEFERLLFYKLLFTGITLALVFVAWAIVRRCDRRRMPTAPMAG
jgi:hypothetical protein